MLFSNVWRENAALFKRLMKIHSNPPILYYGFNNDRKMACLGLARIRLCYTLLKSDVTRRDHMVHCHGSQECWFTLCQFRCQFHSRWHSLRITLKSTTLVHMRSRYVWTRKSWQQSEWRLDFNSVLSIPWSETGSQSGMYYSRMYLECNSLMDSHESPHDFFFSQWFKHALSICYLIPVSSGLKEKMCSMLKNSAVIKKMWLCSYLR